jgi:hypothetical protein
LARAAAAIAMARADAMANRSTISRLREPRQALTDNVLRLRSAREAVAAAAARAQGLIQQASRELSEAAPYRIPNESPTPGGVRSWNATSRASHAGEAAHLKQIRMASGQVSSSNPGGGGLA